MWTLDGKGDMGVTSGELAEQVGIRVDSTRKILKVLQREGVITRKGDRYVSRPRLGWHVSHITAIEAKTRDWKRGLRQAVRYRLYGDSVFVALPSAIATDAALRRALFEAHGVGLIGIDAQKRTVRTLVRAGRRLVSPPHRIEAEAAALTAIRRR